MTPIQVKWVERWLEITRIQLHIAPKNVDNEPDYVRGYIHIDDKTEHDEHLLQFVKQTANTVEIPDD